MANQMISAGQAVSPAGGSAQLAVPRGGQMLGWWAAASQSVVLNDVATVAAAGAGNQKLTTAACAVGWNPFPLEFVNGLVVNAATGITVIFN